MPDRSSEGQGLISGERQFLNAQRVCEVLPEGLLVGGVPENFDEPPKNAETRVAVREALTRTAVLRCLGDQVVHKSLKSVRARGRGLPQISFEPARVGEEMAHRDLFARRRVCGVKAGKVAAHRLIEVDEPFVDQLHDQRRREVLVMDYTTLRLSADELSEVTAEVMRLLDPLPPAQPTGGPSW